MEKEGGGHLVNNLKAAFAFLSCTLNSNSCQQGPSATLA